MTLAHVLSPRGTDDEQTHPRKVNSNAINPTDQKKRPSTSPVHPVPGEPGVFTSGYWTLSEEKARSLIGGQILDVRQLQGGEYQGKIVFKFRSSSDCRDILTSRDGWSQEMKLVP